MLRRIEFLLSFALLAALGGAVAWLVQSPRLHAQPLAVQPVEVEIAPPKSFPAPPAGRNEGVFDLHTMNENERKIRNALNDAVEFDFIDTPLKDAMDFLAEAHNIPVIIDEHGLTEEGVAIDEPINRTLSKIKMSSALKIVLEPLGLAYVIENEVLKVTTAVAADAKRTTKIYHTGYLKRIDVEPDALAKTIQAVILPDEWRKNAVPPALATTVPKDAAPTRDGQDAVRAWDVQTGKQLRGAWLQNVQAGGETNAGRPHPAQNSVEVLGDMLVVSAPASVHDEIQGLLIQLDHRWETEHGQK